MYLFITLSLTVQIVYTAITKKPYIMAMCYAIKSVPKFEMNKELSMGPILWCLASHDYLFL